MQLKTHTKFDLFVLFPRTKNVAPNCLFPHINKANRDCSRSLGRGGCLPKIIHRGDSSIIHEFITTYWPGPSWLISSAGRAPRRYRLQVFQNLFHAHFRQIAFTENAHIFIVVGLLAHLVHHSTLTPTRAWYFSQALNSQPLELLHNCAIPSHFNKYLSLDTGVNGCLVYNNRLVGLDNLFYVCRYYL